MTNRQLGILCIVILVAASPPPDLVRAILRLALVLACIAILYRKTPL